RMKILIATDGSDYSKAAIDECCRIVIRPENAEVLVVSAYEDAYPIIAEPFALSAEYYQKLDDAVRELAANFVGDAKTSVDVRLGDPKEAIADEAARWNADTIFVGPHCSPNSFERFLVGSVSAAVAARAHCSVEVVRRPA
ncbi:MAG: universal stress protein, partial [Acidobacteriota bacterium]